MTASKESDVTSERLRVLEELVAEVPSPDKYWTKKGREQWHQRAQEILQ